MKSRAGLTRDLGGEASTRGVTELVIGGLGAAMPNAAR